MSLIAYDGQIELEEDDWFEDEDDCEPGDDDGWGCEFGDRCLMPGYDHRREECYTREMAEEWAADDGSEAR